MLDIRGVSKKYEKEDHFILDNINLTFDRGITAILGESGSGKSTLMNIIGALDLNYSGQLLFNDEIINGQNASEYRKNNIGFIFQTFNLIPYLTAFENVLLSLQIKSKKNKRKIKELFTKMGIIDIKDKRPNELSGGQKQRVAIIRAIINDPEIILADEPTGALDPHNTEVVMDILSDLARQGKVVIIVTHSKTVSSYADNIIEMRNSKCEYIMKEEVLEEKSYIKEKKKKFMLFSLFKITYINYKKNLKRNLLITFASSIGIFCISFMFFLNSGIKKYINDEINSNINPKEIEINKTNNILENNVFYETDINKIKNIRHVKNIKTSSTISNMSSIHIENKKYDLVSLTSYNTLKKEKIKKGNKDGLLISEYLAKKINKDVVGKYIKLFIIDDKPKVIEKNIKITGILKSENEMLDNMNYAYISSSLLKNIYKENSLDLKSNSLYAYVDNVKNVDKVKKSIKNYGYSYSNSSKMIKKIFNYVDIVSGVLIGISFISLFVSSIMIYVIMHINVIEKTKDIGIFKALGMNEKEIKLLFLLESGFIGLLSGGFGVLLSSLLSYTINEYTFNSYKSRFLQIDTKFILISIIISIILCSVSGLKPAKKASKLDPVESLRYE